LIEAIFGYITRISIDGIEGSEMEDVKQYLNHPKLNKIVGVSKYHSEILKNRFKAFYDTPQQLNTYIHSIDNAI
jgi:hypothetical protein